MLGKRGPQPYASLMLDEINARAALGHILLFAEIAHSQSFGFGVDHYWRAWHAAVLAIRVAGT